MLEVSSSCTRVPNQVELSKDPPPTLCPRGHWALAGTSVPTPPPSLYHQGWGVTSFLALVRGCRGHTQGQAREHLLTYFLMGAPLRLMQGERRKEKGKVLG